MTKLIDITGKALAGEWGTDDEIGNGVSVLRTTNFTNEGVVDYNNVVTRKITKKNIDEKYLRPGDIIIEKSGGSDKYPVGRVIFFDGPKDTYLFNNFTGLLRVRNIDKWYPRYVFYSLFWNYKKGGTRQFENKTTGLHNLKTDDYVARYEIPDMPYERQVFVCNNLDRILRIINKRKDQMLKLELLIKARFVEMFGSIHDGKFEMKTLSEIVTADKNSIKRGPFGGALKKDDFVEDGYLVYEQRHAIHNDFEYAKYYITQEKYEDMIGFKVIPGDLIISCSGVTLGRIAEVPEGAKEGIINQALLKLSLNHELMLNTFFIQLFRSEEIQEILFGFSRGSGIPNMPSMSEVKAVNFICPPMELQKQYCDFVKQVDKSKFYDIDKEWRSHYDSKAA